MCQTTTIDPAAGLRAESETVKAGEILPVRNTCRWVVRPVPMDGGWCRGTLAINGVLYGARGYHAELEDGQTCLIVDLKKLGGRTHRVILGPDGGQCDCEAKTYRPEATCKHVAAVRAAVAWLEERERLEWSAMAAKAAVDGQAVEAAF